jgi:hypothetical protein
MELLLLLLILADSPFKVESEHFVVESSYELKRLSRSVLEEAEKEYYEISRMMPVSFDGRITIRIAGSLTEYERMQPEGSSAPTWSQGIAYPKKRLLILRGSGITSVDDIMKTLRHELAHIFLHNYSSKEIPRWFSEGFSMYFEERGGLTRGFKLIRQAFSNSYIDLDKLEDGFPEDPIDVQNAYLTSSEFFAYLLSVIKEEGLYKVFEYVKEGLDFKFAIYRVSGKSITELEKGFHKSVRFKYAWLPVITSSSTLWILLTTLFIYVFIVKKRRTSDRLKIMQLEEEEELMQRFKKKSEDRGQYLN